MIPNLGYLGCSAGKHNFVEPCMINTNFYSLNFFFSFFFSFFFFFFFLPFRLRLKIRRSKLRHHMFRIFTHGDEPYRILVVQNRVLFVISGLYLCKREFVGRGKYPENHM